MDVIIIGQSSFKVEIRYMSGDLYGLNDQGFVHCENKCVTPLHIHIIQLANGHVCLRLNHVSMVHNSFLVYQHKLQDGYKQQNDGQNWGQHNPKVFKKMHNKERSMQGTKAYMQVVADYIDIFLLSSLD